MKTVVEKLNEHREALRKIADRLEIKYPENEGSSVSVNIELAIAFLDNVTNELEKL